MKNKVNERVELLWRVLVLIVTGIVLGIWRWVIIVAAIVHWFVVLISGKRDKDLSKFCEYWNSETYRYIKYLTFVTNEKPFPFNPLKVLSKFEK
tara:strand:- start:978 stop:1259 length:282 start_codon:yes stop_codon:yes gene_type:complete